MPKTEDLLDRPLTERQREILAFVTRFYADSGYSMTVRDVCKQFGFSSPNGAVCHLKPLKRRGLIEWLPHQARTIRPTDAGVELVNGGTDG